MKRKGIIMQGPNHRGNLNDTGWAVLLLTQLAVMTGWILMGSILGMLATYLWIASQTSAANEVLKGTSTEGVSIVISALMTMYLGGGGGAFLGAIAGFLFLLFMTPRWIVPKLKAYPSFCHNESEVT
jgi:hypothetical protein